MPEKATFAAGCFWGVEDLFRKVPGVLNATSGYMGGSTINPSYEEVCTGRTGHAEAVQVEYDPDQVPYQDLLNLFWELHDPTQVNGQGVDIGEQYRSAIFYHNDAQKSLAKSSKAHLDESGKYHRPIATEISQAGPFWPAEDYHQRYVEKHQHIH